VRGEVGGEQRPVPSVELRGTFQVPALEVVEGDRGLHEALVEVRVGALGREPQVLEGLVRLLVPAGVEVLDAGREVAVRRLLVPALRIPALRVGGRVGRRLDQVCGADPACTGSGAGSACVKTRD
jgi:hypothetical protein